MNAVAEDQRADQRRLQLGRRVRVHRLDVGARARVDERPAVARHPAGQALAAAQRQLLEQLGVGAGGEPAVERVVRIRVEEQRARRERHEVGQLRRDERHRVRDAQARAHRLRDLVERVDLAVRERDVVEHRALALGRRGADGPDRLRRDAAERDRRGAPRALPSRPRRAAAAGCAGTPTRRRGRAPCRRPAGESRPPLRADRLVVRAGPRSAHRSSRRGRECAPRAGSLRRFSPDG